MLVFGHTFPENHFWSGEFENLKSCLEQTFTKANDQIQIIRLSFFMRPYCRKQLKFIIILTCPLWQCIHVNMSKSHTDTVRGITRRLAYSLLCIYSFWLFLYAVNYLNHHFCWSVHLWPCGHVSISKFPGDTMRAITTGCTTSVTILTPLLSLAWVDRSSSYFRWW